MSLITEVYEALKLLDKANVSELLELLQSDFSSEWVNPDIQKSSISRKVKNKLEILIEMNLVTCEEGESRYHRNSYAIKHNFPTQTKAPQLVDELLEIVKKDEKIYIQALKSINGLLNEIKSPYYVHQYSEDIDKVKEIIGKLETAINNQKYVEVTYNNKSITTQPLKIAEFDGIWYLLHYYDKYKTCLKYRLLDIGDITLTRDTYALDETINLEIKKWHNAWHVPNTSPTQITLWIDDEKKIYFYKKNLLDINVYPERVTPCQDEIEYYIYITHPYEALPIIMQYQPFVTILEQDGDIDLISIYRKILDKTLNQLIT